MNPTDQQFDDRYNNLGGPDGFARCALSFRALVRTLKAQPLALSECRNILHERGLPELEHLMDAAYKVATEGGTIPAEPDAPQTPAEKKAEVEAAQADAKRQRRSEAAKKGAATKRERAKTAK